MSRTEFVRRELDRLGLGQDLDQLKYGNRAYGLPPSGLASTRPMTWVPGQL